MFSAPSLVLAAATTLVLGGLIATATSSGAAEDASVSYSEQPWPESMDLSLITDKNQDALDRATELIDFNKADFGGVFADSTSSVTIRVTSDFGRELARKQFGDDPTIKVVDGTLSLKEASEAGLELIERDATFGLREAVFAWNVDALGDSLKLGVSSPLSEETRSALQRFAAERGWKIDVYVDRQFVRPLKNDSRHEDDPPLAGGFREVARVPGGSNGGYCTGGFGYHIGGGEYMLIAGHCFRRGGAASEMWNTYVSEARKSHVGDRANSSWSDSTGTVQVGTPADYHGDIALVDLSVLGGDSIWWGPPRRHPSWWSPRAKRRLSATTFATAALTRARTAE